jgi:hypothetical protein
MEKAKADALEMAAQANQAAEEEKKESRSRLRQ